MNMFNWAQAWPNCRVGVVSARAGGYKWPWAWEVWAWVVAWVERAPDVYRVLFERCFKPLTSVFVRICRRCHDPKDIFCSISKGRLVVLAGI